jgi:cytochrome c-type biogenesis protein
MFTVATSADPAGGVGVLAAIAAGIVSFLSPCVLPLVPGYLSAVVGVAPAELEHAGKRRLLVPSLLFVSSFSAIFILLGVGATLLGSGFTTHRQLLDKLAAASIVALGTAPPPTGRFCSRSIQPAWRSHSWQPRWRSSG